MPFVLTIKHKLWVDERGIREKREKKREKREQK
jgi:hypothetical protein